MMAVGGMPRPMGSFNAEQDPSLIPASMRYRPLTLIDAGTGLAIDSTTGLPLVDLITVGWLQAQIAIATDPFYRQNRLFYDDDHWQNGDGWTGPRPAAKELGAQQVMQQIERSFVSANCIAEVVDRHAQGVAGREPGWDLVGQHTVEQSDSEGVPASAVPSDPASAAPVSQRQPSPTTPPQPQQGPTPEAVAARDEVSGPLTRWVRDRRVHRLLGRLVVTALLGRRAPVRLFIPRGLISADGQPVFPLNSLDDALSLIYIHDPDPTQAALLQNSETMQEMAGYIRYMPNGTRQAEIVYTQRDFATGDVTTVIRILDGGDRTDGTPGGGGGGLPPVPTSNVGAGNMGSVIYDPSQDAPQEGSIFIDEAELDLNGRLTVAELRIPKLVTPSIVRLQKSINKALTMADRNIDLSGFLERTIFNAQLPGHYEPDPATGKLAFKRDDYQVGGGAVNFVTGLPVRDGATGQITNYTQPHLQYNAPSTPDAFSKTVEMLYELILSKAHQLHYILAGDRYASGESRKQARADFEASLRVTRSELNYIISWMLETVLALAEHLLDAPGRWTDQLRAYADARIDPGPATSEMIKSAIELRAARGISRQLMQLWSGIEDPDAEALVMAEEDRAGVPYPQQGAPISISGGNGGGGTTGTGGSGSGGGGTLGATNDPAAIR